MSSSNIIWTSHEAIKATGGQCPGEWSAYGISIDSRTVKKGDLFIALTGDNGDGHAYVADALNKGAVAAVVSKDIGGMDPAKLLVVGDTLSALQDMGRAARARTGARVIGITGSVGKTGTKEMLATAFGAQGQTHASSKSYNNHWGVPLSLSQMHAGSDVGIFEMGMNHAGEISPLTRMVCPHIAIITNISPVHVGNFENGIEGIANAKAEIFDGFSDGGIAVLPRDSEWFELLATRAQAVGASVYSFGIHDDAQAKMIDCLVAANGTRVRADILGEEVSFTLQIPGHHIAMNALAVLLTVKLAGLDIKKAARALSQQEALAGRGKQEIIDIGDNNNPVVLIDESYNASPEAMKAAFRVLALIDPGRGGRRIAVLGDMYELGADAAKIHADLVMPLQAAGVQLVYTSGPLMKNLYNALPENKRGVHIDDTRELAKIVPDVLVPGDVVMVKGSRGPGEKPRMQLVVEALRTLPSRLKQEKIK